MRVFLKRFPLVREIDGIMRRIIEGVFVLLCFCYVLLPVLTHEASFGKKLGSKGEPVVDDHVTLPSTSVRDIQF